MQDRVTVLGASGYTGRLICGELARAGVPFAVAGRSRRRLKEVARRTGATEVLEADVQRPATLGRLVEAPTRVLVSAVGPFLRLGWPVAEAAAKAGVHYLDTTGEQPFIKRVADELDAPARRSGATLVSGMAWEYAVGDWTAAVAVGRAERPVFDLLSIAYSLAGSSISRGTALSILEMVGARGVSWESGRFRRRTPGSLRRRIAFPWGERRCAWMPFGESVYWGRRGIARTVLTLLRVPRLHSGAVAAASRVGAPLRPLLRPLLRALARRGSGPSEAERLEARFTIVAEADGYRAVASGRDPYGLTAQIIARGAGRLLGSDVGAGVRSPATIGLEPEAALTGVGIVVE